MANFFPVSNEGRGFGPEGFRHRSFIYSMQMAHHEVAGRDLLHLGLKGGAIFSGGFTAGVEAASQGRIEGAWHFAFEDDVFPLGFHAGVRDGDGG